MSHKLKLSCQCRSLTGAARLPSLQTLTRLVCYCEDCQAYARHLNPKEPILGPNGGSDIIQMSPAHFRIKRGKEHLGNLRLSEQGLYRWYATCCNTPICNTPQQANMPLLGLITNNLMANLNTLESLVGPVRFGINAGKQHPIQTPWKVSKSIGIRGMWRTMINVGRWRMAGDHQRSILIDSATGAPLVEPHTLSSEQRSLLFVQATQ